MTNHLLSRRAAAVFAMSSSALSRAHVARRMAQTAKKMSSTQISPTTTFTDMVTLKYVLACPDPPNLSVSATKGIATIIAAYNMMMTARTTLTTPDLPPAEDCHHSRQPRH